MKSSFSKNKIALHIGIALTAGAVMVGCAGNSAKKTSQVEPQHEQTVATVSVEQKSDVTAMPEAGNQGIQPAVTEMANNPEINEPEASTDTSPQIEIVESNKPEKLSFQFGFDKTELSDEDKVVVKEHAQYLINNPEVIVKINGHTDHHGPKTYNEFLSKKRADVIASILIEEGVAESQLEINAMANDEPLQGINDTRKNRRVELKYTEMNMATNNQ